MNSNPFNRKLDEFRKLAAHSINMQAEDINQDVVVFLNFKTSTTKQN